MHTRAEPLPTPPERAPYFRVERAGVTHVLRCPSLFTFGRVAKVLERDHFRSLMMALVAVERGSSLAEAMMAVKNGAADGVALVGGLIGLAWADPVLELAAPVPQSWTAEGLAEFGGAVYEEFYEAGWSLNELLVAALAVGEQVMAMTTIEQDVQQRAAFFARRKAGKSDAESKSNASSSAVESEPSAAES